MNEDSKPGLLNIGSAAEYLGISIDTLRRWEKKGRIQPLRSPGGHRYYSKISLDELFGKRYTRDEETLRRTNVELGIDPQQINPPQTIETPPPDTYNVPPITASNQTDAPPVPEYPIPEVIEETKAPAIPSTEQIPDISNLLHPIEVQEQKPVQMPPPLPEAESVKKIPQETPPAPIDQNIPETSIPDTTASIPNILLPEKENNKLSEDEIEKRINTIIKREEKKSGPNAALIILSAILLVADIALLYFWFTSSRIASPIP